MCDLLYKSFEFFYDGAIRSEAIVTRLCDVPGSNSLTFGRVFNATVKMVEQAIQLFDMVWILTGGGPANSTTTMATFLITEGTKRYNYGIATAASVILFGVALVLAVLYQFFVLRRDVAQADAGSRRVR